VEIPDGIVNWNIVGPILLLVLYGLIDKVLFPLIVKSKSKAIANGEGNGRRKRDAVIEKLTDEIRQLSQSLATHTAEAGIHRQAVKSDCKRIEQDVRDLHGRITVGKKECAQNLNDIGQSLGSRLDNVRSELAMRIDQLTARG